MHYLESISKYYQSQNHNIAIHGYTKQVTTNCSDQLKVTAWTINGNFCFLHYPSLPA